MDLARSLGSVAVTAFGMLRSRLELVAIDIEDEVEHTIGLLLVGTAAVMLGSFALLFLALAAVAAFWDSWRVGALVVAAFVFATLVAMMLGAMALRLRRKPRFLDATLGELEKDHALLARNEP